MLRAADAPRLSLDPASDAAADCMAATILSNAAKTSSDRYGWLGALDHRSRYGTYWFPEPLRSDELDLDNELRLDYFHAEKRHRQLDELRTEAEYSIGLLTIETSAGWESGREQVREGSGGFALEREEGFSNLEFAARHPVWQFVSADGVLDDTIVLGLEVAPPVHTAVSKDLEIVPFAGNLLRVGEHISVQASVGFSTLIGPEGRGASVLESNLVLGYWIPSSDLQLPLVTGVTPMFEINAETGLNHEGRGDTAVLGTVGARWEFDAFGPFQPKFGLGYTFPMNDTAKEDLSWGLITSLILEF